MLVPETPNRLKIKLQSSATGMSSPDWDQHDRLTTQLSADQDAAAAAAAAASGAAAASRGRSHSRTARSGTNDEGSRSRSRSFTLPLRGWGGGKGGGGGGGGGERRQRWASQDSDTYRSGRADTDGYRGSLVNTDIEEEESYRGIGSGANPRQLGSSGDTSTGGGGRTPDDEEEIEERPSRNKSFFGFGRWGNGRGRQRSSSAAQLALAPTAGDSGDETTTDGGSSGGAAAAGGDGGGGGRRRHSSSAAHTVRGAAGGQRSDSVRSRNNRFSSFTGERPTVAPATGPSPDAAEAAAAVTFDPVSQKKPRSGGGGGGRGGRLLQRSHSMKDTLDPEKAGIEPTRLFGGKKKGWGRGSGKAARRASDEGLESRRRALSTSADVAAPSSETPRGFSRSTPDSKATPGKGRWGGRGRTASSAGVGGYDEEDLAPRRRALSTAAAGYGGGGGSLGVTLDSRSKSTSAADGDVGGGRGKGGGKPKKRAFGRPKGVWGSLQVSLDSVGWFNWP